MSEFDLHASQKSHRGLTPVQIFQYLVQHFAAGFQSTCLYSSKGFFLRCLSNQLKSTTGCFAFGCQVYHFLSSVHLVSHAGDQPSFLQYVNNPRGLGLVAAEQIRHRPLAQTVLETQVHQCDKLISRDIGSGNRQMKAQPLFERSGCHADGASERGWQYVLSFTHNQTLPVGFNMVRRNRCNCNYILASLFLFFPLCRFPH